MGAVISNHYQMRVSKLAFAIASAASVLLACASSEFNEEWDPTPAEYKAQMEQWGKDLDNVDGQWTDNEIPMEKEADSELLEDNHGNFKEDGHADDDEEEDSDTAQEEADAAKERNEAQELMEQWGKDHSNSDHQILVENQEKGTKTEASQEEPSVESGISFIGPEPNPELLSQEDKHKHGSNLHHHA